MEQITRRRFLALVAGAAGVGGLAWWQSSNAEPLPTASPASSTAGPTPTSRPMTTPTTIETPPPTSTTLASSVTLEVIERQGWGARDARSEHGNHTIERLTVHHTAVALSENRLAPSRLRSHQAYHQEQGWADLAYHFAIDLEGNVYEARPYSAPGDTFTDYDPTGHFLPVLEGDYSQQQPTEAQIEALVLLLAWAVDEFGVDVELIGGHRDYASTTCPGDNVYGLVSDGSIARRVAERVESGGVELVFLRGEMATTRVSNIEA